MPCNHSMRIFVHCLLPNISLTRLPNLHSQVAAKSFSDAPDGNLQLCQAFAACESANVLVTESAACCRLCSNEIMWRVEHCPACRGPFTGFIFYHMQAAYKAIHTGRLNLFFNCFTEEVFALLNSVRLPCHCRQTCSCAFTRCSFHSLSQYQQN